MVIQMRLGVPTSGSGQLDGRRLPFKYPGRKGFPGGPVAKSAASAVRGLAGAPVPRSSWVAVPQFLSLSSRALQATADEALMPRACAFRQEGPPQ